MGSGQVEAALEAAEVDPAAQEAAVIGQEPRKIAKHAAERVWIIRLPKIVLT